MTALIGITTYNDVAQWRDWSAPAAVLPRTYVDAVRRGGGRPVLLPPGGTPAEAALTVADLDGLVVAGGGDVDPARYGAAMHPATGAPNAERDAWELAMIDCALQAGLPLLAICRGMQLLNVIRGGTLHQHLPHVVGHEEHSGVADDFGRHAVRIGTAGMISRILDPGRAGGGRARRERPPPGRPGDRGIRLACRGRALDRGGHAPPPGGRPAGRRAGGHGVGGGRDGGGGRGRHPGGHAGAARIRRRRAVASGGNRRSAAVRGPGGRGRQRGPRPAPAG